MQNYDTINIFDKRVYPMWEGLSEAEAKVENCTIFDIIDSEFKKSKNVKKYLDKILKSKEDFEDNIDTELAIYTDPQCKLWEYLLRKNPKLINLYFEYFKGIYSDSFFLIVFKSLLNKNPTLKVYYDGVL